MLIKYGTFGYICKEEEKLSTTCRAKMLLDEMSLTVRQLSLLGLVTI